MRAFFPRIRSEYAYLRPVQIRTLRRLKRGLSKKKDTACGRGLCLKSLADRYGATARAAQPQSTNSAIMRFMGRAKPNMPALGKIPETCKRAMWFGLLMPTAQSFLRLDAELPRAGGVTAAV